MQDATEADILQHNQKEEDKCVKHVDQLLEFYCDECKCIACYICYVTAHSQHKCVGLMYADKKFTEQIKHELEVGKAIENSCHKQLDNVRKRMKELDEFYEKEFSILKSDTSNVKQAIQDCFKLIIQEIDKHEDVAENNLSQMKEKEILHLTNIADNLKKKISIQKQKNSTKEEYLSPALAVFQRAKLCALSTDKVREEAQGSMSTNGFALPLISLKLEATSKFNVKLTMIEFRNSIMLSKLHQITMLSVYNNKILVSSCSFTNDIYVFNCDGVKLSSFTVSAEHLFSAVWISDSHLICTVDTEDKPIVLSECGNIIAELSVFKRGRHVYVSNKTNFIYIADWFTGLYKSEDGGRHWYLLFTKTNLLQAVLVKEDTEIQVFWTLIYTQNKHCLRECVIYKQKKVSWRDIDNKIWPEISTKLDWKSMMAYDENDTIFVSCPRKNAVFAYSVSSLKERESLSITKGLDEPSGLAIDTKKKLLYIGNKGCIIKIFDLIETICVEIGVNKTSLLFIKE